MTDFNDILTMPIGASILSSGVRHPVVVSRVLDFMKAQPELTKSTHRY